MLCLRFLAATALAVACAFLVVLSSGNTDASHIPGTPQFNPTFDIRLCNVLPAAFSGPTSVKGTGPACTPDGTPAPSGHPDIGTTFNVPLGHMNYAQDYFVTAVKDFNLSAGHAAIPPGIPMGGLSGTMSLGLLVNVNPSGCTQDAASPEFIWWNATVDNSPANTFAVSPEGTANRFLTLAQETIAGGTIDNDAFPMKADSNANVVLRYPDISNRLFDPDGDGIDTDGNPGSRWDQPLQPIARYAGLSQVPTGGDWQLLQVFTFAAGDLQKAFSANANTRTHPFAKLGTEMGQTVVTVLNDPTAVTPSVSPISDFCSPLAWDATLLGRVDIDGDNVVDTDRIDAPASGQYMAQVRTMSQRDADGDGIENSFDTCPFAANTEDPYNTAGPDADGYDSACDPTPGVNTNGGDHDGDGFLNPQDNCPSSASNDDVEPGLPRTTAAPDGGPSGDSIGAGCDGVVSPGNPGGAGAATGADGDFFGMIYIDAVCITDLSVVDADGDGWCSSDPYGYSDTDDADPNVHPGGTYSKRLPSAADSDGGGIVYQLDNDSQEWAVGTDPLNRCPLVYGHDTWPPDFDRDGRTDILDIVQLTPPYFNVSPPSPYYIVRKDLNSDGFMNILDIVQLTPPVFHRQCNF